MQHFMLQINGSGWLINTCRFNYKDDNVYTAFYPLSLILVPKFSKLIYLILLDIKWVKLPLLTGRQVQTLQ